LLLKLEWRDVGQALLDALTGEDEEIALEVTLKIARKLPPGEAQQAMLASTTRLSDKALRSSNNLENLWAFVLYSGDDATLQTLSAKFLHMRPRWLTYAAKTLVQLLKDTNVVEDKKAVLVPIVTCRSDWLESQIRVLEKPFSWEMPVAEFPDNGSVEAFLRGPEEETTTKGMISFQNLGRAIDFSYAYSGGWPRVQEGCSFKMKTGEEESDVFVTVTKTRKWYDENQGNLPQLKEELGELSST
jgi:hypothetical protein